MKEYSPAEVRNFAVVGHASSGKTMLSEAMLACAGVINRLGSIASGNTVSDYHESEKQRQISVSASLLHLEWLGKKLNLIDCPGYTDFISEGLGALRVGDVLHRDLLEVVGDDDRPSFFGDGEQCATREVPLLAPAHHVFGRLRGVGDVGRRAFGLELLVAIPREASIVGRLTNGDREEPRTQRARRGVLGEPSIDDDEDLVRDVFEIAIGHPESPQRVPHERKLRFEDRSEVGARSVCRRCGHVPCLVGDVVRSHGNRPTSIGTNANANAGVDQISAPSASRRVGLRGT